jgi:hypothetical protein
MPAATSPTKPRTNDGKNGTRERRAVNPFVSSLLRAALFRVGPKDYIASRLSRRAMSTEPPSKKSSAPAAVPAPTPASAQLKLGESGVAGTGDDLGQRTLARSAAPNGAIWN